MVPSEIPLARPTPQHLAWAGCEIGVIIHCDIEICAPDWAFMRHGEIQPPPPVTVFNPTQLDTDQWIRAARAAGATYAVLTAKHVSGFTLFPDPEYDYSIRDTPFQDGKGDIVRDFVASCRKYGIKPGLYYSCEANAHLGIHKGSGHLPAYPSEEWDAFTTLVTRHLSIIWGQYGELFEIWFDGGLLEHGPDYISLLRRYQPGAVCFQGPHEWPMNIRWVGNERGEAPYPCWSTNGLQDHDFDGTEEQRQLGTGDPDGSVWMPAETDVPLRFMQWFWIPGQDGLVMPPEELLKIYYRSVGRNSNLLLGIVIDDRGLVPDADVNALASFGQEINRRFASPVAATQGEGLEINLPIDSSAEINTVVLMEEIVAGHRILAWILEGLTTQGNWVELARGSAVGHKCIDQFTPIQVENVRIRVTTARGTPVLAALQVFDLDPVDFEE